MFPGRSVCSIPMMHTTIGHRKLSAQLVNPRDDAADNSMAVDNIGQLSPHLL
jgi:hypothetical protein